MDKKIIFVPLDSRPCSFLFPLKLASIINHQLIIPKRDFLGKLYQEADICYLQKFLLQAENCQDVILSLDMMAYGGLVASRLPKIDYSTAEKNLLFLAKLKDKKPNLNITAFGTITRIAPTDGKETFYSEVKDRNRKINETAVELAKQGVFTDLIFGSDDTNPSSPSFNERLHLEELSTQNKNIFVNNGADELGMLSLARVLSQNCQHKIKVCVHYSTPTEGSNTDRYEDLPAKEIIKRQIAFTRAEQVFSPEPADVYFLVKTPFQKQEEVTCCRKKKTADELFYQKNFIFKIKELIKEQKIVALADTTYANGVDGSFIGSLLKEQILTDKLASFSGWNTTANTLGTALSHGIIYFLGQHLPAFNEKKHQEFIIERLLDDWAYQSVIRQKVKRQFSSLENKILIEDFINRKLNFYSRQLFYNLSAQRKHFPQITIKSVSLPWNRLFEAEIDVQLGN